MKYDVHIFAIVRVKRVAVEADSQVEAIKKAEADTDLNQLFNRGGDGDMNTEYTDDIDCFHVDEQGDTEYENSTWYDKDYSPL